MWRIGRASDCLVSHACVPGSNPVDHTRVSIKNVILSPLSIRLDDHGNGALVELLFISRRARVASSFECIYKRHNAYKYAIKHLLA